MNPNALETPIPVKFTKRQKQQIDEAEKGLGLSKQDVIRIASEVGLRVLARLDYDLPGMLSRFGLEKTDSIRHEAIPGDTAHAIIAARKRKSSSAPQPKQ